MAARRSRYRAGVLAEAAAAWMLRAKGWRILGRRVRTPVGEIDLIARRGQVTIFVEVKRRRRGDDALQALTPRQRRRIMQAARFWLAAHPRALDGPCRFDLVAVNRWLWPRHVIHAFDEGTDGRWD
ncbi:MAG TPA: YraN family protein [Thermopetrobacter sp.]|nr:YraN family protein [Thermopetrobacter sp.]